MDYNRNGALGKNVGYKGLYLLHEPGEDADVNLEGGAGDKDEGRVKLAQHAGPDVGAIGLGAGLGPCRFVRQFLPRSEAEGANTDRLNFQVRVQDRIAFSVDKHTNMSRIVSVDPRTNMRAVFVEHGAYEVQIKNEDLELLYGVPETAQIHTIYMGGNEHERCSPLLWRIIRKFNPQHLVLNRLVIEEEDTRWFIRNVFDFGACMRAMQGTVHQMTLIHNFTPNDFEALAGAIPRCNIRKVILWGSMGVTTEQVVAVMEQNLGNVRIFSGTESDVAYDRIIAEWGVLSLEGRIGPDQTVVPRVLGLMSEPPTMVPREGLLLVVGDSKVIMRRVAGFLLEMD